MRRSKVINKDFTKDRLPSTRKELFFDIVKNHFGTLTIIGFILLLFAIPYIAVLIVSDYASYDLYNALQNGEITKEQYASMFNSTSLYLSLIQIASLMIFSIGASGVSKVFKRLLFMEPVFFKEDFKMGVKDSFKSFLVFYLILGISLSLTRIMSFVNANAIVKAIPMGVIIVFIFPIFMLLNIHTTIYKSKLSTRIKLCTFLHIKNFFINMPACLIVLGWYFLIYIPSMVWKYVALLACVVLLLPMALLLYYDFCFYIFDKNINIITYPEIYRKGMIDKTKKEEIPMKINVLENGVISSAELLQTKQVQELVNNLKSGDTLYFPKGDYVVGTIFLKSDMTIEVEKGATIWGAPSFYDFAPQEKIDYPAYQDQSHTYFDCSMFVGKKLKNISFIGEGTIDMRSVWDLDNVRDIVHRGPKCITLVECDNVKMTGLTILNVTDLAVYFVSSTNVYIDGLKLKVYIDGISPDNSKHCVIKNCDVEAGDDGVVFKSSYNLNRLDYCDDILVENCNIKSRCNPVKFGTESNGGFKNIKVANCTFRDSRITGIALESVDGAKVENIEFSNIKMYNIGSPFFVYIGKRMRGPKELEIGSIKNVLFENIEVLGPYHVYDCMAWNYASYVAKDNKQFPGFFSKQEVEPSGTWQITSNICGLPDHLIENITFRNIYMELDGGVKEFNPKVPDEPTSSYPEIYVYGRILPSYGMYFRYVKGVTLENINIKLLNEDSREKFAFDNVENITM